MSSSNIVRHACSSGGEWGSAISAWSARSGSPVRADSTISSPKLDLRRDVAGDGFHDGRHDLGMDAVAVDHRRDLDDGPVGHVGDEPVVGNVDGQDVGRRARPHGGDDRDHLFQAVADPLRRERQRRVDDAVGQPLGEPVQSFEDVDRRRVVAADVEREREVLTDVAVDRARHDPVGADHMGDHGAVELIGEESQRRCAHHLLHHTGPRCGRVVEERLGEELPQTRGRRSSPVRRWRISVKKVKWLMPEALASMSRRAHAEKLVSPLTPMGIS